MFDLPNDFIKDTRVACILINWVPEASLGVSNNLAVTLLYLTKKSVEISWRAILRSFFSYRGYYSWPLFDVFCKGYYASAAVENKWQGLIFLILATLLVSVTMSMINLQFLKSAQPCTMNEPPVLEVCIVSVRKNVAARLCRGHTGIHLALMGWSLSDRVRFSLKYFLTARKIAVMLLICTFLTIISTLWMSSIFQDTPKPLEVCRAQDHGNLNFSDVRSPGAEFK